MTKVHSCNGYLTAIFSQFESTSSSCSTPLQTKVSRYDQEEDG